MNRAIFKTREIYSKVGVGVGRVKWFAIPVSLADGPAGGLIACRSTGEPVFAGELRLEGDRAAFALSAVARPGAFPLTVEVHWPRPLSPSARSFLARSSSRSNSPCRST